MNNLPRIYREVIQVWMINEILEALKLKTRQKAIWNTGILNYKLKKMTWIASVQLLRYGDKISKFSTGNPCLYDCWIVMPSVKNWVTLERYLQHERCWRYAPTKNVEGRKRQTKFVENDICFCYCLKNIILIKK